MELLTDGYKCRNCKEARTARISQPRTKYISIRYEEMKTDAANFRAFLIWLRFHKIAYKKLRGQIQIQGFIINVHNGYFRLFAPQPARLRITVNVCGGEFHSVYNKLQYFSCCICAIYSPGGFYIPLAVLVVQTNLQPQP
jgi:hypothetical protein